MRTASIISKVGNFVSVILNLKVYKTMSNVLDYVTKSIYSIFIRKFYNSAEEILITTTHDCKY